MVKERSGKRKGFEMVKDKGGGGERKMRVEDNWIVIKFRLVYPRLPRAQ